MCGEMAGDQVAVPILLGLGLDEFSMSATSILKTRSLLKTLDSKKMEELADKAVNDCETADEVVELVNQYTKQFSITYIKGLRGEYLLELF